MSEISRNVSRPLARLSAEYSWRWRGRHDVHGHRQLKVDAIYSHNEEPVVDSLRADAHRLPNEIVIELEQGQDRRNSTIRLDRSAAAALRDMLEDALAWDGVAP